MENISEIELIKALVFSLRTFSNNVPDDEKQWTSFDEAALNAGFEYIEKKGA